MKVSELMNPKGVLLYAKIDNSADALGILVELQEGIGVITNGNAYYNAVSYRETFGGTTAIGGGIALPHACNAGVSAPGISALLLRRGVDWGAPDGEPVDLVFMIAVPPGSESLHLQILARRACRPQGRLRPARAEHQDRLAGTVRKVGHQRQSGRGAEVNSIKNRMPFRKTASCFFIAL